MQKLIKNFNKKPTTLYSLAMGFFLFFLIALSKNSLGPDEQTYLSVGKTFLEEGVYSYNKAHPLLSLFSASINKIFHNPLLTYKFIYGLSGMMLSLGIYKILKEIMLEERYMKMVHFLVLLTPGILLLCLYAISNIFYTSMAYCSIYLLFKGVKEESLLIIALSGFCVGLSYLARMDGLVLFFCSLLILTLISYLDRKRLPKQYLFVFTIFFVFPITPWQIHLYSNDLILSTVINGGFASGFWDDGIAKYILGEGTRIKISELKFIDHFFIPTAKNIVLFSENIASIKSYPFFLWAFVGFGFYELKYRYDYLIFLIPSITTLAYLLFFVETRFLLSALPLLGILSSLGFLNILKRNNLDIERYFWFMIYFLMFIDFCFLILWLH